MEIGEMNIDDNGQCRASLAEMEQDRAMGVNDTTEQIVQDRVIELMGADSTDEDSIVVLMESERFKKALRNLLGSNEPKELMSFESCNQAIIVLRLKKAAETVLSEYVELGL